MQANYIREGQTYAVSTEPRKGVSPEKLHKVAGIRQMHVLAKGVERWAEHAKDSHGDRDGEYKKDGVRAISANLLARQVPEISAYVEILKPRDFLMPWAEFQERKENDDAAALARRAEEDRIAAEREGLARDVASRLTAMGLTEVTTAYSTQIENFEVRHNQEIHMSMKSMVKLLDAVSAQVYELLRDQ